MAFATDDNLHDLIPTIFDHGQESYADDLARAEADVIRKIKMKWHDNRYHNRDFDQSLLTETQWTLATVYRAIGYYIMPKLSQWQPESDSFREQIAFYQSRFNEEMNDQFGVGIEYDYDEDNTIDESEVYKQSQTRLYR